MDMAHLQFKILEPGDRPLYDGVLSRFALGDYAQSWEWGELKARSGWTPIRVSVSDARSVRLVATILFRKLPVPLVRWSIGYCPRGPVTDPEDADALHTFLEGAHELGRRRGAILLKLDPDLEGTDDALWMLQTLGLRKGRRRGAFDGFQPRHVARLPLVSSPAETFLGMRPKGRYNIRLSYRRGVRVVGGSRDDLPAFYDLLLETSARQRFFVRDFAHVQDLYDLFVAGGKGILLLAFREGQLLSGALVARSGRKASYLLGGSSGSGRQHMAPYLVQWEAIRWAHAHSAVVYDFLGIGDPKRPGRLKGLWDFKRQFGASAVSFVGEWDLPLAFGPYLLWTVFESFFSKARFLSARVRKVAQKPRPVLGEVHG